MKLEFDFDFFKNLLKNINAYIYITDVETDEIIFMSDYMKRAFHLKEAEGQVCWKVIQKGMNQRCSFCKIGQLLESSERKSCVWRLKNTLTGRIYMNHDSLQHWNGRIYHVQHSIDITDQLRLSMEASIDELTGIRNRKAGHKKLETLLAGLEPYEILSIVLYDMNGLKWVNDTHGHMAGDQLLVFTAHQIQKELKEPDFVFRLSGDEFIIVFRNQDLLNTEKWMQDIKQQIQEEWRAKGMDYDVSFSYGIATVSGEDHMSVSDVLSIADSQMYIQKRDFHILVGNERFLREKNIQAKSPTFQYNKEYLFEALSETLNAYAFVGNLKTGEFMYSKNMVKDFGLPGQVLSNAAAFWGEKIHSEDVMSFLRSNQEVADGRSDRHTIIYRARDIHGAWVPLVCRGRMIRDDSGRPDLFAGVIRRKEQLKHAERIFLNAQKQSMFQKADFLLCFRLNLQTDRLEEIWDSQNPALHAGNSEMGYAFVFHSLYETIAYQEDRKRFAAAYAPERVWEYVKLKENIPVFEFHQTQKNGQIIWVSLSLRVVPSPKDDHPVLFGTTRNIDLRKKRELSLVQKANRDLVSGCYDSTTTKLLIENIFQDKEKQKGYKALVLLDIDDFHMANHMGSIKEGDQILSQMADEIIQSIPESCIAGRMIGDVFVLFYYDMESSDAIRESAEQLRQRLCRSYQTEKRQIAFCLSAGLAVCDSVNPSYEKLHQHAFYALDTAKRNGKNQLVCYEDLLEEHVKEPVAVRKISLDVKDRYIWHRELNQIIELCWKMLEQNEEERKVQSTFLEKLGNLLHANRILLLNKEKSENTLTHVLTWKTGDSLEKENTFYDKGWIFQEILEKVYPDFSTIILDKYSADYHRLLEFYEGEQPLYPVMVTGVYEREKLRSCLLIEGGMICHLQGEILELIVNFLRRLGHICLLQREFLYTKHHDVKTGLRNYENYIRFMESANDETYSSFGIAGIRITGLKEYNQKYGERRGDEVITFAAETLSQIFGRSTCYRMSSGEFLTLCPDISYPVFLSRCRQMEEKMELHYPGLFASANVWEIQPTSLICLHEQMEEKLQIAVVKQRSSDYEMKDFTAKELLSEIQEAIHEGNFRIFLQPKADTKTGNICGAEALIRYTHKEVGLVPPAKFLPIIEKAGLIRHIDLFVLEGVCQFLKNWEAEGYSLFPVSVNFSRATILAPDILDGVNEIVEKYGVSRELIEIEITETIGSIDNASLSGIVDQFVNCGYKVALDDFGSEYSNIYILYSLNINSLKLDRRIVRDIYHDNRARLVVESVIHICQKLNITSVAEGVETKEHLDILKEMGCDRIQGYYLNKPLPEDEFRKQHLYI